MERRLKRSRKYQKGKLDISDIRRRYSKEEKMMTSRSLEVVLAI
jgi:hypothetical protein